LFERRGGTLHVTSEMTSSIEARNFTNDKAPSTYARGILVVLYMVGKALGGGRNWNKGSHEAKSSATRVLLTPSPRALQCVKLGHSFFIKKKLCWGTHWVDDGIFGVALLRS